MSDTLIYLFSSNIRPLYEQDILDVLGAPEGTLYSFRYNSAYVSDDLAARWDDDTLLDVPVMVHFSLQQARKEQPAVFIPVRRGVVTETTRVGEFLVIEFEIGQHVALVAPPADTRGRPDFAKRVTDYTDHLRDREVPCPYEMSASIAPDVTAGFLDTGASTSVSEFTRTAEFLQGTDSFESSRFLRFLSLAEPGEDEVEPVDGVFTLRGGRTYVLRLFHAQPVDVAGRDGFHISADQDIIRVIGDDRFEIASRYDVVTVVLHAVRPSTTEAIETVLLVGPDEGVNGPTLRLRLRVKLPAARTVGTIATTSLGLVLVGLPGILTVADPLKVLLLVTGGLIASTSAVVGLRRSA